MLFEYGDKIFESYKERNFCYKFFAGYYFNEFIPDWDERLIHFNNLLSIAQNPLIMTKSKKISFDPKYTHVSFDNHECQFRGMDGRGEFADMFVHDRLNNNLAIIEVKLYTRTTGEKDIRKNLERIERIFGNHEQLSLIQCFLIPQDDKEYLIRQINSNLASFGWLQSSNGIGPLLLTWEDLIEKCKCSRIKDYANYLLNLLKANRKYVISNGDIIRYKSK